jgi:hypothetical protein
VAEDVGSTTITQADVARVYGDTAEEIDTRMDRGRAKMSAWLALLEAMEDAESKGCNRCGEKTCSGSGPGCEARRREGDAALAKLPPIGMPVTAAMARVAARLRREGSAAFAIED